MPEFEYTARSIEGHIQHGTMTAQDVHDIEEKLKLQNLTLTESHLGHKRAIGMSFFDRLQTVPLIQRMFFTQYLQVMIRAGFSISRALETLAKQTSQAYFRRVIESIRTDVESGMSFSKSLSKHPRVFGELYVSMVAAGEASGKLDDVLGRLAIKMKKDHALVSKIRGAMTYPIIIIIAMIGVGILMTVVVIPKLTEIFQESNATLPLPTRILIAISQFLLQNGLLVSVIVFVCAIALIRLAKTAAGKRLFDKILLHLPIFGVIIHKVSLARFTRSLSSLLETNIPIIDTFSIISRTMGNFFYRRAIEEAGLRLKTGSTIAKVLEASPSLFPPLTTQMISIGEETGTLDSISGQLATFYEEEVDQTVANISTIIEPVLMLFLGVGVAVLAVSIILPIYSLTQQIG